MGVTDTPKPLESVSSGVSAPSAAPKEGAINDADTLSRDAGESIINKETLQNDPYAKALDQAEFKNVKFKNKKDAENGSTVTEYSINLDGGNGTVKFIRNSNRLTVQLTMTTPSFVEVRSKLKSSRDIDNSDLTLGAKNAVKKYRNPEEK